MMAKYIPFFKKKEPQLRLGLWFYQQQIFYVIYDQKGQLVKAEHLDCESSDMQEMMGFLIKKEPLIKNCKINLTVGLGQFINKQISKPDGDQDQWLPKIWASLSDVVDYPITQSVIDYYMMPIGRRSQDAMLSIIAINQQSLRSWVDICHANDCFIERIITPDIAIRNVVWQSMQGQKDCVACLYIQNNESLLIIQKEDVIYLTRFIRHGMNSDPSLFVLELRRSIDYFDGYYNESSISVIMIYSVSPMTDQLKDMIERDFSAVVIEESGVDKEFMSHLAMGGAIHAARH